VSLSLVKSGRSDLAPIGDAAREFLKQQLSANTLKTHKSGWAQFVKWCQLNNAPSLPARSTTVADFIADRGGAGLRVSTLESYIAAISAYHRATGADNPACTPIVRDVMKGIRRKLGTAQHGKAAILTRDLDRIVHKLNEEGRCMTQRMRDKAILLLGFAGAFRRSELTALNVGDVEFAEDGMKVTIKRSKTDQIGAAHVQGILIGETEMCPVRAVKDWLDKYTPGAADSPLFPRVRRGGNITTDRLTPAAVGEIVKHRVMAAGLDPKNYAGHSLRAGFATQAILNGVPEAIAQGHTRHKSTAVFRRYVRTGSLFRDNPSGKVGL
jgi:integrase